MSIQYARCILVIKSNDDLLEFACHRIYVTTDHKRTRFRIIRMSLDNPCLMQVRHTDMF